MRGVEEFLALFLADAEAVDARKLGGDVFRERAVGLKYVDALGGIRADVDEAFLVHDDAAVGGPDLQLVGDVSPLGHGLESVCAAAGDDGDGVLRVVARRGVSAGDFVGMGEKGGCKQERDREEGETHGGEDGNSRQRVKRGLAGQGCAGGWR